jgi:hypothetical protein
MSVWANDLRSESCSGWQSNNKFLTNLFFFAYLMVTSNNFTFNPLNTYVRVL